MYVSSSHLSVFNGSPISQCFLEHQQVKEERLPFFLQLQNDPLCLPYLFSLCLQSQRKSFVVHLNALQHKRRHRSCEEKENLQN